MRYMRPRVEREELASSSASASASELCSAVGRSGLPYRHRFPFQRNMCQDNVNLPKEANKARCFVISCFVLCASPGAHGGDGCTTN